MSRPPSITRTTLRRSAAALLLATIACGDRTPPGGTPVAAASVSNARAEPELTTISLTPQAARRLGIETAAVERRAVPRTRELGGEVIAPPGRRIVVQAPVAGTVLASGGGALPGAGSSVASGDVVLRLLALPPDRDVLRAEEEGRTTAARLTLARAEADRFAQLAATGAATKRENEQARTALATAEEASRAAQARLDQLTGKGVAGGTGLTPLAIIAPDGGTLLDVSVTPGQIVAAGTPLFEVVRLEELWVRVPVYAGDAAGVAAGRGATVQALGDAGTRRAARAITAPPTANAAAASVDLYYALPNRDRRFRPGQSVTVSVPLAGGEETALVVPRGAILYDINGGSWVYELVSEHTFVRRRVELRAVSDDVAIVARGLAEGMAIVRTGAAELFGTEFGTGK